jgi:hypothetical protein
MNPHGAIDGRMLEMDRLIAGRLRQNPSAVIGKAHSVLENWLQSCDESARPAFDEWRKILEGPVAQILETLEGTDERSMRLRQSSPFCGIITPEERSAILAAWAPGTENFKRSTEAG